MADLVSKNVCFWALLRTIVVKVQDDCRCVNWAFAEGRSSSVEMGLSKECKGFFNGACAMPWCRTVVDFEVKKFSGEKEPFLSRVSQ